MRSNADDTGFRSFKLAEVVAWSRLADTEPSEGRPRSSKIAEAERTWSSCSERAVSVFKRRFSSESSACSLDMVKQSLWPGRQNHHKHRSYCTNFTTNQPSTQVHATAGKLVSYMFIQS